jgi:epoxyqueuosine reductase
VSSDPTCLADAVRRVGLDAGLSRVGFASAEPFVEARRILEERKAQGLHGGMQFTYRNPTRSTDASQTLPGVRSIVVGALGYSRRRSPAPPTGPHGRVARYAVDDHYGQLRTALGAVAAHLVSEGWHTRVVADDNALVDRAAAHRAGLGWFGKNANLLLPGEGSWFVLGSVLTDAPIAPSPAPVADGCGACTRCIEACPTGAIVAPGVVDARRCLAWLVQAEGSFPVEFREALADRIYGCDDCQEVCPPSRRGSDGVGAHTDAGWVPLIDLLDADDEALLARHGRWYIARRDPRYLRRNALVALGNVGSGHDDDVVRVLRRYLCSDDALLREHAEWAARRLGILAGDRL